MSEILAQLSKFPIQTRVSLTGTLVVARDIAHAKLQERLEEGLPMPEYMLNHPVYYAGPAKTPQVRMAFKTFRNLATYWYMYVVPTLRQTKDVSLYG